jgi:hypothetical protein
MTLKRIQNAFSSTSKKKEPKTITKAEIEQLKNFFISARMGSNPAYIHGVLLLDRLMEKAE